MKQFNDIKKILEDNDVLVPHWYCNYPFIYKKENEYIISKYLFDINDEKNNSRLLKHLIIKIPDYPVIDENNVIFFEFAAKIFKVSNKHKTINESLYLVRSQNMAIIEEEDINDFYLLIYTSTTGDTNGKINRYNCHIYHNCSLVLELNNITNIDYIKDRGLNFFDPDNITYRTTIADEKIGRKKMFYSEGRKVEIKQKSLLTWCKENGRTDIIDNVILIEGNMAIEDPNLPWDDKNNIILKCPSCKEGRYSREICRLTSSLNNPILCSDCQYKVDQLRLTCVRKELDELYSDAQKYGLYDQVYINENGEKEFSFLIKKLTSKGSYVALEVASQEESFHVIDESTAAVTYKLRDYSKINFLTYCLFKGQKDQYSDEDTHKAVLIYEEEQKRFNRFLMMKCLLVENGSIMSDYRKYKVKLDELKQENYCKKEWLTLYNDIYANLVKLKVVESRWKSELYLYHLVKGFYSDTIYQYTTNWLDRQSLDIYIPSLNISIEYQGKQHYEPIDFFGGKDAYEETVKRDKKKKQLCKDNGVSLIYWKYDEPIEVDLLKTKMKETLE